LLIGAVTGFLVLGDQGFVDTLQSRFTSLPTVIFGWSRLPSSGFRELTSAAIIVLLALTLTANTIAILLRNRYERKW
jgi:phosphate transport system permease protein